MDEQANLEMWAKGEQYHDEHLIPPDDALDYALKSSESKSLPIFMAVSKSQGKFLYLLLKSIQAKRVLEVGTLSGYSTIWLARALPEDGEVVTLEIDPQFAEAALDNFKYAGLDGKIKLILGSAEDTMKTLPSTAQFDLIFIDADKEQTFEYFIEAKRLVRKGGIIIVDNVIRYGLVADPDYTSEEVEGIRHFVKYVQTDDTVEATTISTVGQKGYDGFMYILKL